MERSEEEKVLRSSVVVTLGGVEHEIRPLVIAEAREWRKKFARLIGQLPAYANTSTDDAEGYEAAVSALYVQVPDEMSDLFFAYAKDLDREEIEATATEAELADALEAVMGVAFPLVGSLTGALGKLAR